ncbi:MAG TPA: HPF/RaiA family ribosome-associated protein [Actinomycetes bacterium]|jgi:ribosome-associated translation inhibitor RaiA
MAHQESAAVLHPQVHTHGDVPADARAYAVAKVEAALHHAPGPVLRTSLTLDSAAPGDRVDAHVYVDGVGVHVHAVGQTLQEATDLMQERLRSRLRRIRRRPAQGPHPPAQKPVEEVEEVEEEEEAGG